MEFEHRIVLGDVDCPSFDFDREHGLGVEDQAAEARESRVVRIWGHCASPKVNADSAVGPDSPDSVVHFFVHMSKDLEPNNVLIPVHKRLEPFRPLLKTAIAARRDMAKQDADLSICFHLVKSLLKPFKLITGVVSELHQEKVCVIARFRVDSNNSNFVHLGSIT